MDCKCNVVSHPGTRFLAGRDVAVVLTKPRSLLLLPPYVNRR